MKIIQPIAISHNMVGSAAGTVAEADYAAWAIGTTYAAADRVIVLSGHGGWEEAFNLPSGVTAVRQFATAPNGNVYLTHYGGLIYVQLNGEGPFVAATADVRNWWGICVCPTTGDVYASVGATGDIYRQAAGTGSFTALGGTTRSWRGMCAHPTNRNIYACVYGGDIYMRTSGAGSFSTLSVGSKNWVGMAASPTTGDIYAGVYGEDIYVQSAGAGAFNVIADTNRNWAAMSPHPTNGNIYAVDMQAAGAGADIYMRTAGAGVFASFGKVDTGIVFPYCAAGVSRESKIYVAYDGAVFVTCFKYYEPHKIYESLVGSNLANFPASDVLATTPKWIEVSATNKWKVFDVKTTSQMQVVSPAVYTITPGVAHDSIALLNVSATSVRVQGTSGAYDTTVATGASDIVLTNLGGLAANVLTITITNTAGLAKCGEIIVGNYYSLGTFKPLPTVGIIDYSTKTQDVFGDWTIVPRSYSEKMSCQVNVPYASLDAVIAKLKDYRTTPIVWIGNTSYVCTIVFGYVKDWSVPVATRGAAILSLEIEGLT